MFRVAKKRRGPGRVPRAVAHPLRIAGDGARAPATAGDGSLSGLQGVRANAKELVRRARAIAYLACVFDTLQFSFETRNEGLNQYDLRAATLQSISQPSLANPSRDHEPSQPAGLAPGGPRPSSP